jgi:aldehyde dehydrogenase (NAD+)
MPKILRFDVLDRLGIKPENLGAGVGGSEGWVRMTPAPVRGQAVREIGEEFRKQKRDLGALVSLEMGKIKAEGQGEVQEMVDIAEFAVGLSRQLYGLAMHSERPHHRM